MNTEVNIRGTVCVNSDEFVSDGLSGFIQVQLLIAVCRKLVLVVTFICCSYNILFVTFSYDYCL